MVNVQNGDGGGNVLYYVKWVVYDTAKAVEDQRLGGAEGVSDANDVSVSAGSRVQPPVNN